MGNRCFVPLQGGEINTISPANPAAGANWSYTFPASYEQEIRTIECKLTAAVAVANRRARFQVLEPGGAVIVDLLFTAYTTTGEVSVFSLFVGCSRPDYSLIIAVGNHVYNDALPTMRIVPGCTVQSLFTALNAADQFSDIKIMSHMWRV